MRFAEGRINEGDAVGLIDRELASAKFVPKLFQERSRIDCRGIEKNLLPRLGFGAVGRPCDRVDLPHRVLRQLKTLRMPETENQSIVVAIESSKLKGPNEFNSAICGKLSFKEIEKKIGPLRPL